MVVYVVVDLDYGYVCVYDDVHVHVHDHALGRSDRRRTA